MDNEYGRMFKRLMNERNELRKYIIDICELLDINTSQSILGANCLEFYAVLSSTAKNKIGDLQEQFSRKEQECEELKEALNEIRQYRVCEINDEGGEEDDVILGIIDEVMEIYPYDK